MTAFVARDGDASPIMPKVVTIHNEAPSSAAPYRRAPPRPRLAPIGPPTWRVLGTVAVALFGSGLLVAGPGGDRRRGRRRGHG